jgi:hypothetical protein
MRTLEQSREYYSRPEVKERVREYYQRPEVKARVAANRKERLKDPELKARRVASQNKYAQRPKTKARLAAQHKERWGNPEKRKLLQNRIDNYRESPVGRRGNFRRQVSYKYGVEWVVYEKMLLDSGGHCDLCGQQFDCQDPHLDHNHHTGALRGLLCQVCNMSLAAVDRYGLEWFSKADAYLRRQTGS